jgi:hypothetical protein
VLPVSDDQLTAMARARDTRFVTRLTERLGRRFPGRMASFGVEREAEEPFVAALVNRARGYGIRYEADIALYLDAAMTLGPQFDTDPMHPEIATVLSNPELTGDEKMDFVDEYLVFGTGGAPV